MGVQQRIVGRKLGRTQYQVSPLGLGGHTYPIGMSPDDFVTPDGRAALVEYLVDAGVNYFDTTWLNEVEALADAFRRTGIGQDCLVSLQFVDGMSDPKWRDKLRDQVEARLRILDYTSAPLFIVGIGNGQVPYSEMVAVCEAMAQLKSEGLIQHIGVSCHQIGYFAPLARLIAETDLLDYMMIRYNWQVQQAREELFPVAREHDVGLVLMKVFCWDCGPGQWGRRISVFEPLSDQERRGDLAPLTAAQRSLIWCLQTAPPAVAVPAINTMWEAEQDLRSLDHLDAPVDTRDFQAYATRLWTQSKLQQLSEKAESATIRERARKLLTV